MKRIVVATWVSAIMSVVACGGAGVPRAPSVAAPKPVTSSSSSSAAPTSAAIDPEREWHTFAPKGFVNTFFPILNALTDQHQCSVQGPSRGFQGAAFVACGRDLARFVGPKLDATEFRNAPIAHGWRPKWLHGRYPDNLWVTLEAPPWVLEKAGSDAFTGTQFSMVRLHGGTWTAYATSDNHEQPSQKGSVSFVLPAVKHGSIDLAKPDCADYACANALPRFVGVDTETPDFSALAGRVGRRSA